MLNLSDTPPVHAEEDDDDDDDDSEPHASSDASSSPARRFKRKKRNDQPKWQTVDVATLQKNLLSSDGESSDVEIIESILDTQKAGESSPNKRKRSRSGSITPPPALSDYQLANAKYLVRQALAVEPRAPSPTFLPDDSIDNITLDPELAKIVEAVKKQATQPKIDAEQTGGPETVTLKVNWVPHPLNVAASKPTWTRQMKRHDAFRILFEETADLASILVDNLVVTYDGKRVFPSGTPHSLRIWTEGELEACDKSTYDYMRTRRLQPSHSPAPEVDASEEEMLSDDHSHAESDAESSGGDKLKLVFRSTVADDVTLTVRPTTTCGAIVKAFLKAADIPDIYSDVPPKGRGPKRIPYPQLKIDGEKQSPDAEIGHADLEDGDLVEVVGI
ncbi:hypothetical protein EDC04DRAFT_168 [Pisolithus marmoratus]|nr:hypothetical protein EDC04DRAFT_168 [Pisolithus marmoratus]